MDGGWSWSAYSSCDKLLCCASRNVAEMAVDKSLQQKVRKMLNATKSSSNRILSSRRSHVIGSEEVDVPLINCNDLSLSLESPLLSNRHRGSCANIIILLSCPLSLPFPSSTVSTVLFTF
jgi:hypothetical protein